MAHLPQDILLKIFSKVPTKSIGRFRTLSKYWNTQLSTSFFIKKHLISCHEEHVALVTREKTVRITTYPTKNEGEVKSLPGKWFCILGSVNGLILLGGCLDMLLVNPITCKQVIIQPTQYWSCHHCNDYGVGYDCCACNVYGLGYDSCSDDYKIVQICCFWSKNVVDGIAKTFVDVYSVKKGVWKRVDGCYPYGELVPTIDYERGAFLNGAVHWIIGRAGYRSCITAFDLAKEVFNEIPLPKEFVRQLSNEAILLTRLRRSSTLFVVGGCLSIVDNNGNGTIDIWIMKEYGVAESWSRFSIADVDERFPPLVEILCYAEDGELLCLIDCVYVFACDLKEGTMKEVARGGFGDLYYDGMTFVDSLVSPEGLW